MTFEVPSLSQQILAGLEVHSVWMDLEPSRRRTNWTSWWIEAPTEVQDTEMVAADDDSAEDGRSESRYGAGGQRSERGQAAGGSGL